MTGKAQWSGSAYTSSLILRHILPQAQALYLSSQRCMWGSFPIQLPLLRIYTPSNSHTCAWIHACTSTHMQICITNRWTYAHTCIDSCVHTVHTHMHPECTCTAYSCACSHTHACTFHLVNSSSLHKCSTLFIREVAHDLTVEKVSFFPLCHETYWIVLSNLCFPIRMEVPCQKTLSTCFCSL